MRFEGNGLRLFATDLTNFLGCHHVTALDRLAVHKLAKRPFFDDPMLEILRERGLAHERAYVESLVCAGKRVVEIDKQSPEAAAETLSAMRSGADAIVQARLEDGRWGGWADVLIRVDGNSNFGGWRYEPVETKLARETRGSTLIQLCLYGELVAGVQGVAPEWLRVVVPDRGFEPESYRFEEFWAYFRHVRRKFEVAIAEPLPSTLSAVPSYPEPVPHCDVCNWYPNCSKRWAEDDHVSLVANIRKNQRKELEKWGVTTLQGLAELPLPIPHKPSRGSVSSFESIREQARLQLEARTTGKATYELLPIEQAHGLAALPSPSPLDLFLDLEGDRLAERGGFDYLFGYAFRDEAGSVRYEALWAVSPEAERQSFERLMDLIAERRARDPGMHVYHYAPYETTALKRLMGRHATRADELDDLLRAEVFVDLYSVVRRAIRAGVDSYSIKKLEPLYGLVREVDLRLVSRLLRTVEYSIAKRAADSLPAGIVEAVQSYNQDDCASALELRQWLESLRLEAERARGAPLPRPKPQISTPKEDLAERLARIRAVSDALVEGLPVERDRYQQAQWILAQLLEWHRREDKVDWWEYHRLNDTPADELVGERDALAGLEFDRRIETTRRGVVVDRYIYPAQDTDIDDGDEVFEPGSEDIKKVASVEAIDREHRIIDLRKGKANADRHPRAVFKHDSVSNPEAVHALLRLGEFVRDHGIDAAGRLRAARDLVLRSNPRLGAGHVLRYPAESTVDSARRAVLALEAGVLAIQGPPGSGKTFSGARMILDLVRAGKKVGVTAVSHKVIRNLLEQVVKAAEEVGSSVKCMHRLTNKSKSPVSGIEEEADPGKAVKNILAHEHDVVGGTAWVWAKEELAGSIDVLFVDEAGQMSLANTLACAQAAKNLVLLGDPQQLEQPQKASHPEGSELSALEYLLEGHDTMPEERGLFLGETWRLHPAICGFTSDLFYESKLGPHPGLEAQVISGPTRFVGAGLFYVAVEHEGNQNVSPEEAERVAEIVRDLTQTGVTWTDRDGHTRALALDDILIVAPYNAQVAEIGERIPGARVGTVDKFQGQEAPVVVYSMATSSAEEAPHGMEFLFSRHRLNVATSRARCVCILVASPQLFELDCRTPERIRMANAFCAYLERAAVN